MTVYRIVLQDDTNDNISKVWHFDTDKPKNFSSKLDKLLWAAVHLGKSFDIEGSSNKPIYVNVFADGVKSSSDFYVSTKPHHTDMCRELLKLDSETGGWYDLKDVKIIHLIYSPPIDIFTSNFQLSNHHVLTHYTMGQSC